MEGSEEELPGVEIKAQTLWHRVRIYVTTIGHFPAHLVAGLSRCILDCLYHRLCVPRSEELRLLLDLSDGQEFRETPGMSLTGSGKHWTMPCRKGLFRRMVLLWKLKGDFSEYLCNIITLFYINVWTLTSCVVGTRFKARINYWKRNKRKNRIAIVSRVRAQWRN